MPYQNRIIGASTGFNPEDDGVWTLADYLGDGSPGLVYIKTKNTGTKFIEVHRVSIKSRFQERSDGKASLFGSEDNNGTWLMRDFTGDGKADLVYIKTRNTKNQKVEVYVADAASDYKKLAFQAETSFDVEEKGTWTMTTKGDLVYLQTRKTRKGKVEFNVASKASKYQESTTYVTDFDEEEKGTWGIAPHTIDADLPDLYYIKTQDVATGTVEVHAATAKSQFKNRTPRCVTGFVPENNGTWLMTDFSRQLRPDLAYIKTKNTGTPRVEVHVNPYQDAIWNPLMYEPIQ